jgi:mannosyltransferase OCH1-like enzyme
MIPKTIHYCWFGGNPKPKLAQKCIKSWEKYCPDWRFAQLMSNFYSYYKSDLFYNEDNQFMEKLECYIYNEVASKPDPDDFWYYQKEN